jgi:hypothetical protein
MEFREFGGNSGIEISGFFLVVVAASCMAFHSAQ